MGDCGQKPLKWSALFRDGHAIEQGEDHDYSLRQLKEYLHGSGDNPKRHYLLWFKLIDDSGYCGYTVNFDLDGDAYIYTGDGDMLMTKYKIRSAELVYGREIDDSGGGWITIGFGGLNTVGLLEAKAIKVTPHHTWKVVRNIVADYDKLKL